MYPAYLQNHAEAQFLNTKHYNIYNIWAPTFYIMFYVMCSFGLHFFTFNLFQHIHLVEVISKPLRSVNRTDTENRGEILVSCRFGSDPISRLFDACARDAYISRTHVILILRSIHLVKQGPPHPSVDFGAHVRNHSSGHSLPRAPILQSTLHDSSPTLPRDFRGKRLEGSPRGTFN